MKIELITTYAGPRGTWTAGSTIDLPDEEAKELIAGGYASCVEVATSTKVKTVPDAEVETAVIEVPEKAVSRGKGRRKG